MVDHTPTPDPFAPATLGNLTLRNRIIKAATFEGVMPRGKVSEELIEFHRNVAAGGVAMTTVAYCATSMSGRVHRDTMVMSDAIVPDLTRLTDAVHAEGAKAQAQIGHAGYVANQVSNGTKTLGPSTRFAAPAMGIVKAATVEQIRGIIADYVNAARVARDSGFDSVEVHMGHNYFVSSFFSPNLNKRTDAYGGSIENRARLAREILEAIRAEVGTEIALTGKLNMVDGVAKGLWINESLQIAELLQDDGHLDALQLTGGSSLLNGMYFFRGPVPMQEFVDAQPKMVGLGLKVYGPRIFPTYPFEEGFFLPEARQFRDRLTMPLILLGGINKVDTIHHAMDEGFEFVAMGRALLREPDLINKMQAGRDESLCIHCNKCMPTIYSGTRCVITDPDPIRVAR
ncbi:MAG: NADH:flavin oxidoreductase [Microthrixaceae bacterium]|nr:NADH:flavin oxidoreductase [Microthrixaceae bacterium]